MGFNATIVGFATFKGGVTNTSTMTILSQILHHKIIAIIRGVHPTDLLNVVSALQEGGIMVVEVTLNSADALRGIKNISKNFKGKMLVGAGTVLDAASAKEAIDAGAQFIISPCFDEATIRATRKQGSLSIPGAYTPTEIVNAYKAGGDIIKVFPASNPQYIKDIRGPLSHIPLMPTGGITPENILSFQDAGGVAFGVGSSLVNVKQTITRESLQHLTQTASRFVEAIQRKNVGNVF